MGQSGECDCAFRCEVHIEEATGCATVRYSVQQEGRHFHIVVDGDVSTWSDTDLAFEASRLLRSKGKTARTIEIIWG